MLVLQLTGAPPLNCGMRQMPRLKLDAFWNGSKGSKIVIKNFNNVMKSIDAPLNEWYYNNVKRETPMTITGQAEKGGQRWI